METLLIVFSLVLLGLVILLAIWIIRSMRKHQESRRTGIKKPQTKIDQWLEWIFEQYHLIALIIGSPLAWIKYVHKAWKSAPVGSIEKFGWASALGAIIATVLFVVLLMIDQKLNGPKRSSAVDWQDDTGDQKLMDMIHSGSSKTFEVGSPK